MENRKKIPLSVFIITKNEADRVADAINSVSEWVDEVIVVDSGSTDDTLQIAESLGAKTYFREWEGFGLQKRYGESLCSNQWILNLDADEVITDSLKKAIIKLFDEGNFAFDAYRVKRRIVHPAKKKKIYSFGPGDYFVRLYDRDKAEYKDSPVHDSVMFKDPAMGDKDIGTLDGIMLHHSFRSYRHMVEKINFYSSMQALDMTKKNRKISALRIITEPFTCFLKAYILRRYFLWGVDGFIESVIYAFARTIRLAKAREISQGVREN